MAKEPENIEPIDGKFDDVVGAIAPMAKSYTQPEQLEMTFEVIEYTNPRIIDPIDFRIDQETKNIWATQAQIAQLFESDVSNISRHLKNIFEEGELDENSNLQKLQIATSTKPITLYSLDAIISVGYRVSSKSATRFRQWATNTIKAYVEQGYVINEEALRRSPEKLNKLAAKLRALRSEEKQVYAKVRECFMISASDYDPNDRQVRSFYALLQDKFLHAVTGQTSSKIIMERADHLVENMGLQALKGKYPTIVEVTIGKNYLSTEELYRLHILSEQFMLYAEARALAGQKMTMKSLHRQLDRLMELNDYPVFDGYKDWIKDQAVEHAKRELTLLKKRLKIESLGMDYSEEALANGEYDDILISS